MASRLYALLTFLFLTITLIGQSKLHISSPASIAGDYDISKALFGNGFSDTLKGEIIIAQNGTATTGNTAITNNIAGKIAIVDRGDSSFSVKAKNVQDAGAIAFILCNNRNATEIFAMVGDPSLTIPSVMISQNDCIKIKAAANGAQGYFFFLDPTGAEPVLYSETFNGGKGAWTTKGLSAARDTFKWDAKGITNGALAGFRIDAPTADNGTMVFDADFLTTQGDTNKIPNGPPPYPQHTGELISPVINCSTFNSVTLKFFELYAGLNGSTYISYSTDGGATWAANIEVNEDLQPNETTPRGKFLKIDLPQLANKAQARVKFVFDGDFYAWVIDDVKLLGKSAFDLAVQPKQFFFPFNYATPASQIGTDTSTFSADVANFGLNAATNVKMKVKITTSAGTVLHSDSLVIPNLPAGAMDTTFFFAKSFIPGKLSAGTYKLTYSVEGGSGSPADTDPTNNTQSQTFIITTDLYAKDDGLANNSGYRASNDGDYFVGNLYNTSTDWNANDKFKASDVTFGCFMPAADGTLKGKSATIYLAELLPTIDRNFDNFDVSKSIVDNTAQLKIIGIGTHEFTQAQSETPTVTIQDVISFNDKVDLKKGTRYLVGVSYSEGLNKAYTFHELDISYFYVSTLKYDAGSWYSFPYGAVIRMKLELSTAIDQIQLPETSLQLLPNPTTDYIKATVKFEKSTNVNFTIADINGRLLQFQSRKNVVNDTYEFDTRSYAPGTYLMRISTDEGTKTKKFVVAR
ncbi:MAG: PA domain-containing protein [Saprospiraceae bacterium]